MNQNTEVRFERAASSARAWAEREAAASVDDALTSVRESADVVRIEEVPDRRRFLVAGAAITIAMLGGVGLLVAGRRGDDVLVPATIEAPPTVASAPDADASVPDRDDSPTTRVDDGGAPAVESTEPGASASEPDGRAFVVEFGDTRLQDTFVKSEAVLGFGDGVEELGRTDCDTCALDRPMAPAMSFESSVVVADTVNQRVQIIDIGRLTYLREEFNSQDPSAQEFMPIVSMPIGDVPPIDGATIESIGQPLVETNGSEILVPVAYTRLDGSTVAAVERFRSRGGADYEYVGAVLSDPDGVSFSVDDEFRLEGRALVHMPDAATSGATQRTGVVLDLGNQVSFIPIVRSPKPGEYVVTDETGTEAMWTVPFTGHPTGLADGSVVVAGTRTDSPAPSDPASLLLRLWPDGTHALSRFTAGDAVGRPVVGASGGATISTVAEGWLVQQWPLPAPSLEPPTAPDQDIGSCESLTRFMTIDEANGYEFPWTVSGGLAGSNGAYVAVYDALGRTVIGGGCSSVSQPPDPMTVRGASYRTYGDSLLVVLAEPLSLGGVNDVPEWLGEPIVTGLIESLQSEIQVFRVPNDRELPTSDNDNTLLLVQIRGARLTPISSSGIGVFVDQPGNPASADDPFGLQPLAVDFVQGYLDALAGERWDDAVTYIENDGRNWQDRPAFADLFALVGEDVGSPSALEQWCTEERDCTRGVANGVVQQLNDRQVSVAITFEVPGGSLFEQTINPVWTVGTYEGSLYIDGLPQVVN